MIKAVSISVFFVTIILLVTVSSGYAFKENIVAAWLMEEGAGDKVKDFTGHFSDGKIIGDFEWTNGKFGKALKFDGSTTYVQIPFNPKYQMLNVGDFTFAGWFKPAIVPEGAAWFAGFQQVNLNGTGRTWMGVQQNTNGTYTFLGGAFTVGALPEADQWYHFAVVVEEKGDTDNIQIYSNGKPEEASMRGIETCEGDFLIGSPKSLNSVNFWNGLIDEVTIVNKALAMEEIGQLMNSGLQSILAVESRGKLAATWGELKSSR